MNTVVTSIKIPNRKAPLPGDIYKDPIHDTFYILGYGPDRKPVAISLTSGNC